MNDEVCICTSLVYELLIAGVQNGDVHQRERLKVNKQFTLHIQKIKHLGRL